MRTRELEIEFVTPAFLGGANQSAEWRTPPFKALLRQWWRVWASHRISREYREIREVEGVLFGHAFLEHRRKAWQLRSPVRLRLRSPSPKNLSMAFDVQRQDAGRSSFTRGRARYSPREHSLLMHNRPAARFLLRYPAAVSYGAEKVIDVQEGLDAALRLAHVVGAVGGRSRNGWGSLRISEGGRELVPPDRLAETLRPYSRPLEEALATDWADTVGRDDKGLLVWQAEAKTLPEIMGLLAEKKRAVRKKLSSAGKKPFPERLLLGYPVKSPKIQGWTRLPCQLRFKVHKAGDGRYAGLVYHMPHGLPSVLEQQIRGVRDDALRDFQLDVWRRVHDVLDREMTRVG